MRSIFTKISNSKNIFAYSSILILIVYLITRLQYFLYYPVIILSSDSASYCAVALDMLSSRTPIFDIRTPGYPVFLFAVWMFSKSFFSLALVQSLLTVGTSIVFLWIISKTYRSMTFLFAISLAVFISSSYFILLEDSVLTEGIFVNMLIVNAGLLILSLKENKICCWSLYSLSIAVLILIRPAALFLCGIVVLLIIFFLIKRYKLKFYLALIIPFTVIILSLCFYNYFTLKLFTITPFGEANLAGVTILFMEPSESYSPAINEAIKNTLDSISKKDIAFVKNSWGFSKLYHLFNENFYRQVNFTENLMRLNPELTFVNVQPITRMVSTDAIKKNPGVYAKFLICNLAFFFNNLRSTMDYYTQLSSVYQRVVIDKKYITELESGRWRQMSSDKLDNERVKEFFVSQIEKQKDLEYFEVKDSNTVEIKPTILKSIFQFYQDAYDFLFRNFLWLILYFIVFILSIFKLVQSRVRNTDALIALLLCLTLLTKAILVSLVEVSLVRYSYTVEYVIYFSLPFLFILLRNSTTDNSENKI